MKGRAQLTFDVYTYTNKGGRDYNEDFCGYWQESGKGAFVMADGLGGHGHGEVAAELATKYILDTIKNDFKTDDEYLLKIMNGANDEVLNHQKSEPAHQNIRTTIAAAFFSEDVFKYFNVGDSRLYYFKSGCLYEQSRDHSVPQMAVMLGEITADEIRRHEDRSKLLKVLGDTENLNINKIETGIKIEKGDAFILCSDGFWEHVFETEMELDLIKSSSPEEWCEFMCKRLLRRVTGNNDNFSLICGKMTGEVIESGWTPPFQVIQQEIPKTTEDITPIKQKKNLKIIAIGIVAIVVIACIITGIILLSGRKKPSPPPDLPPTTTEEEADPEETDPEETTEAVPENDEAEDN
jgi:serine/threonine protein phosphatase PrpC